MVAATGSEYYWVWWLAMRVHPWWLRLMVVASVLLIALSWVMVSALVDERKKRAQRAKRAAEKERILASLPPESRRIVEHALTLPPTERELFVRHLRSSYLRKTRSEPATDGTCAHWIPEGMR